VDQLGSFEALAQIALGIAGFSGVVVAVSDRPVQHERSDSVRILSLLTLSLGGLVLALLPSGLALAEVSRAAIWRGGSAAAVLGWLAWALYFPRRIRQLPRGVMFPAPILATSGAGHLVNFGAQVLNSAGLFPSLAASIYYFGIVWVLLFSAAIFANVVFRRPER
jgi:hypothetical protein